MMARNLQPNRDRETALRALIDHPNTPHNEREAARSVLDRLLKRKAQESTPVRDETFEQRLQAHRERCHSFGLDAAWIRRGWPRNWPGPRSNPIEVTVYREWPQAQTCLVWKCPGCGNTVRRTFDDLMLMLLASPASLMRKLEMDLKCGAVCQLCDDCFNYGQHLPDPTAVDTCGS